MAYGDTMTVTSGDSSSAFGTTHWFPDPYNPFPQYYYPWWNHFWTVPPTPPKHVCPNCGKCPCCGK